MFIFLFFSLSIFRLAPLVLLFPSFFFHLTPHTHTHTLSPSLSCDFFVTVWSVLFRSSSLASSFPCPMPVLKKACLFFRSSIANLPKRKRKNDNFTAQLSQRRGNQSALFFVVSIFFLLVLPHSNLDQQNNNYQETTNKRTLDLRTSVFFFSFCHPFSSHTFPSSLLSPSLPSIHPRTHIHQYLYSSTPSSLYLDTIRHT